MVATLCSVEALSTRGERSECRSQQHGYAGNRSKLTPSTIFGIIRGTILGTISVETAVWRNLRLKMSLLIL